MNSTSPTHVMNPKFATLQAEAALRGYSLVQVDGHDGRPAYVITRWMLSRSLPSLSALESFLGRIGVHHGE